MEGSMSDYSKQYTNRINNNSGWENYTSTATPLSAANLNKMDQAIQNIDNAVYNAVNSKANITTVNGCINSISFNHTTGVFTIGFVNGTSTTINTALEKVMTNFVYDSTTQSLVLTYENGTTESISLEEFITEYEFEDSDTIGFSVEDGHVTAEIIDGSITGEKLDPDYLSDCEDQVDTAKDYARQARSYATGDAVDDQGDPYRSGQGIDNSKYYYQLAHEAASSSGAAPFIGATDQTGGTQGLVPGPLIADKDKFLKGDGSWGEAGIPTFVGTQSEWNALSLSEKAKYEIVQITDDNTFSNIPQTDVANAQVGFTSSDTTDANANSWTSVVPIASSESLGGLFGKVSQMFKNVRYLFNQVNPIGTIVYGTINSVSMPSGERTQVGSITLSKGVWLIQWKGWTPSSSYGNDNCVEIGSAAQLRIFSGLAMFSLTAIYKANSDNTVVPLYNTQLSGSTVTTNTASQCNAVRIR
jgi:hypothetical protein